MAFLAKHRKEELIALAEDMGIEISPTDKKIHIYKKVKDSSDFEEEFVRGCLEEIVRQRVELKAKAEAAELKAQAEAAELKRIESLRQEREFELKKIRLSNAVVTRRQKLENETESGAVIKPPPQRPVQDENPIIVGEELVPLPLPQAEGDTLSLLKVSSGTFASEQNNCTSLKSSWEREKEGKSEIDNGLNSHISVKETQTENSNDIVSNFECGKHSTRD
ncbi:hypothetical protein AVEN_50192-1 [Araneus ventricosus]|uniref:Uncharacterized protein n=1 Tax=Araneus ventricosus TaxID=182803 RepID=A0A4Y1ZKV1_ARAVE|nr:hypothetical protein AVEN_50192-1 [Araneus ventricosus]